MSIYVFVLICKVLVEEENVAEVVGMIQDGEVIGEMGFEGEGWERMQKKGVGGRFVMGLGMRGEACF